MIKNWSEFLQQKPKEGIYLFIGKEEYLLSKITEHIKDNIEGETTFFNLFVLKQKELPSALIKGVERSLFDNSKRIIKIEIARDFKMKKKKDFESFIELIPKVSNYVLLYGKMLNSKSKFVEICINRGIETFYVYPLNDREKYKFIAGILEKYNIKADRKIILKILETGHRELFMIEGEIRKLALYILDKKTVEEKDINEVFSLKKEEEIDNLLNNLFKPTGKKILGNLFKDKLDPIYIWSSILNYFLLLYWLKIYIKVNNNEKFLITRFRLYYNKKALIRVAKIFPEKKLNLILKKIYSIEREFKYSSKDKKYLIESFIDFLIFEIE
jgi:DNA polymerase III delta subunit